MKVLRLSGLLLAVAILCVAVSAQAIEKSYNKNGISFKYTDTWTIEDESNELGSLKSALVSVDSPGSAFLSIALYHREEGFEDTLNAARDGLKQNFEAFGTVVVEEYTDNFAETDFKGYRLTVKAFGIPHTNCVVGAIVNGKTVIISWQYADEDLEQFGKDIDLIKGSLAISK